MATIVYTLSPKTDKLLCKHEILVRFFHGRISLRGKTGMFTLEENWDQERQCNKIPKIRVMTADKKDIVRELNEQNGQLKALGQFIMSEFLESGGGKDALGKDWLKDVLEKFKTKDIVIEEEEETEVAKKETMLDVFTRYIDKEHNMADSQRVQHRVIHRALHRFTLYTGISIEFEDFTADTLRELEHFLLHEHEFITEEEVDGKKRVYINDRKYKKAYEKVPECRFPKQRSKNTVIKLMTRLRTFMRWARKEKYIKDYPFDDYDMGTPLYGTPIYLTKAERNQLYLAKFPDNPGLEVQRDIFVFQCFIGCRVGDFMKMTKDNIINGAIEYIPRKTKEGKPYIVRVPLNSIALEILEKYKDTPGDALLPCHKFDSHYNDDIKEMCFLAGLDRTVTTLNPTTREEEKHPMYEVASSHMARRCFIGNLYKQVQNPNLVGKLSGHAEGSKAFARYRDIDEEMQRELVKMLE